MIEMTFREVGVTSGVGIDLSSHAQVVALGQDIGPRAIVEVPGAQPQAVRTM